MEAREVAEPAEVAEVAASLGAPSVAAEAVGWGDTGATLRLVLADGRILAARRLPGSDTAEARRLASVMRSMADAGLPTLGPDLTVTAQATWLSIPWVEGTTGAAWLDTPRRARQLATAMGALAERFERLDPVEFERVIPEVDAEDRIAAVERWLANVVLEPPVRRVVEAAWHGRDGVGAGPSAVVHGDFAPINVIVSPDGAIAALLDFEYTRVGRRHADVAWWGWVVRHHHPEAWAAAWPTFCRAAGIDPDVASADLRNLAIVGLVERAATAPDAARLRWVERLREAATWPPSP